MRRVLAWLAVVVCSLSACGTERPRLEIEVDAPDGIPLGGEATVTVRLRAFDDTGPLDTLEDLVDVQPGGTAAGVSVIGEVGPGRALTRTLRILTSQFIGWRTVPVPLTVTGGRYEVRSGAGFIAGAAPLVVEPSFAPPITSTSVLPYEIPALSARPDGSLRMIVREPSFRHGSIDVASDGTTVTSAAFAAGVGGPFALLPSGEIAGSSRDGSPAVVFMASDGTVARSFPLSFTVLAITAAPSGVYVAARVPLSDAIQLVHVDVNGQATRFDTGDALVFSWDPTVLVALDTGHVVVASDHGLSILTPAGTRAGNAVDGVYKTLVALPGGRVVVGGCHRDRVVLEWYGATGAREHTVAGVPLTLGETCVEAIAVTADGRAYALVVGASDRNSPRTIMRTSATGQFDATYGGAATVGRAAFGIERLAVDSSDRVVAAMQARLMRLAP